MARLARRLKARARAGKGRLGSRFPPRRTPSLLFFTDPVRTPRPETIVARLPRGSAVVYRAFGAADARAGGKALAQTARRRGVRLLVGADPGLAVYVGADGLHLPQRLARQRGRIGLLKRRFLVTAAAHGLPAALGAARAGVDALVVSPVFPSASPSARSPLGVRRFAALVRAVNIPVFALGGVNAVSARRLGRSGAAGLAAIDGFMIGAARVAATFRT